MIALVLIAIFLFVGWIALQFPFSEYELIELTLCTVVALTAVVIVAATMIISKLNYIHKFLEESKKNKNEKSE